MLLLSKPTVLENLEKRCQTKKYMYIYYIVPLINNSTSQKLVYNDRRGGGVHESGGSSGGKNGTDGTFGI